MAKLLFQLSTSHDWESGVIRHIQGSPFSHADAWVWRPLNGKWAHIPIGSLLGASNSPNAPVLAGNCNGVAIRPHNYQDFKLRRVAVVEVTDAQHDKFWELELSQLGKNFDGSALYDFISDEPFDRDWRLDDHWFCSELHIWALEQIGFFDFPLIVPKNRISPPTMLMLIWPKMINKATFWLPPPGMILGRREIVFLKNMDVAKAETMFKQHAELMADKV